MTKSERLAAIVDRGPVIAVLTVARPSTAVPMARALIEGGIDVIEVTLRTEAALEAIRRVRAEVPQAIIGAGSVKTVPQFAAAEAAGARFIVSPGHAPGLLDAAEASDTPYLPASATVSEAMALLERGHAIQKLFPAEVVGGVSYLKAVGAPLPEVRFCPTGGITEDTAKAYLGLGNVACVGGSWLTPASIVESGDWSAVTRLAAAAAALNRR